MNNKNPEANLVPSGTRYVSKWVKEPLKCVKFDTTSHLDGRVAVITLSRPKKRNAWSEIMRNEIIHCIETASKMKKIRAVIITGDPAGKAFCFGADLTPTSPENPFSVEGDFPEGRMPDKVYYRDGGGVAGLAIVRSLKPVICAVNGNAVGVGLTLPTCCDITVAAKGAKVGFVFAKRGLTMECLSSTFLSKVVGHKMAMELVLTGRVFNAEDAPPGLFNHVVDKEKVMDKALEIAAEICETSAMSSMINRNLVIRNHSLSPEEAHLVESKSLFYSFNHEDFKEGVMSFLQKRPPNYPMDPFSQSPEWFPWWKEVNVRPKL